MRRFPIFLLAVVMLTGCKDKAQLPTVSTGGNEIFHETHIVACEGMVSDDGGATVFERGICYMTGGGTPTIEGTHKTGGSGRGSFTCPLSNLPLGAYSYRAYAINEVGTAYGEVCAFELTDLPTVSTGSYTVNGSNLTAVCNGIVTYNGGGELTETGICYMSGTGMPTVNNNCVRTEGATTSISVTLTGLSYSTNYCYRAFATNSRGTAYGEVKTINVPAKLPTVTTGTGTPNMNNRTAVCTGTVTNSGATSLTETGICYVAGNGTPTINNSRARTTNAATSINVTLSSLTLGTIYSYRAYATNAGGTSYGATQTFTMPDGKPTVTTGTYSVNGDNSAVCHGTVTNTGASALTQTGICYMAGTGTPTINNDKVTTTGAATNISVVLSGLANSTTYSYRAFATNSQGTSYGAVKTFTSYWVDLGLPSGRLWATCNLGAGTPEEYGNYYAWAETSPKSNYNWSTYTYCNGGLDQLTKYCTNSSYGYNGFTDGQTTLLAEDDAATAALGYGARTPTKTMWQELIDNCTSVWTTQNGVEGYLFTGPNGKTLFLPAANNMQYTSLTGGSFGHYWSSTLTSPPIWAYALSFYSDNSITANLLAHRADGCSIRAVRLPSK